MIRWRESGADSRANYKRSTTVRPDRSFSKIEVEAIQRFAGREVLIHAPVLRFAQNLLHTDWNGSKLKVMRLLNRNIVMLCSCRNNFSAASRRGYPSRQRQFLGTRSLFLPIARLTLFSNTQISHAPVHTGGSGYIRCPRRTTDQTAFYQR